MHFRRARDVRKRIKTKEIDKKGRKQKSESRNQKEAEEN